MNLIFNYDFGTHNAAHSSPQLQLWENNMNATQLKMGGEFGFNH